MVFKFNFIKQFNKKLSFRESSWFEFWNKFRKNHLAIACLVIFIIICLSCIAAPLLSRWSWNIIDLNNRFKPPSSEHIFGTDYLGRDIFVRTLYGGRNTLSFTFAAVAIAGVLGTIIGLISGFLGERTDFYIMRIIDAMASVPSLFLAIVMEAALGWGKGNFLYALAIAAIPAIAKLVRASVMDVMGSEFITASRALGMSNTGILFHHVFHNIAPSLLIQITSTASETMLACTILGYLGIGVLPPNPEWGNMVFESTNYFREYPFIVLCPSIAIVLSALSVNIIGNSLRDALKPGRK